MNKLTHSHSQSNGLAILANLATKDDLKALEISLRTQMDANMAMLRVELSSQMNSLETRLLMKLGGLMAALLTLFKVL